MSYTPDLVIIDGHKSWHAHPDFGMARATFARQFTVECRHPDCGGTVARPQIVDAACTFDGAALLKVKHEQQHEQQPAGHEQ